MARPSEAKWRDTLGKLPTKARTTAEIIDVRSVDVRVRSRLCENSDPQLARRISISISSISESIALAASFERRQLRKQFCASVAEARFHTAWVNLDRAVRTMSGLLPLTTELRTSLVVRSCQFLP